MGWRHYENKSFTVDDGESDYDVKGNGDAFDVLDEGADYVRLISDKDISVKKNATTNNSITLDSTNNRTLRGYFSVSNFYITNASGAQAAIKLYMKLYHF